MTSEYKDKSQCTQSDIRSNVSFCQVSRHYVVDRTFFTSSPHLISHTEHRLAQAKTVRMFSFLAPVILFSIPFVSIHAYHFQEGFWVKKKWVKILSNYFLTFHLTKERQCALFRDLGLFIRCSLPYYPLASVSPASSDSILGMKIVFPPFI